MNFDKFSHLDAFPLGRNEKIVGVGECTQAAAEPKNKIVEAISLTSNLMCHALYDKEYIFRPVRKLHHDEMNVLFVSLSDCDVCTQRQAWDSTAYNQRQHNNPRLVEAAANKWSMIRCGTPHRKA